MLPTVSGTSDIVCTCTHGSNHDSCPMHRIPADSTRCRLQGSQDDLGMALMSMLGSLMTPVTSTTAVADEPSSGPLGYVLLAPSDWTPPPESPPPRS